VDEYRSFGDALRFFRKRARLTQDELGRAVGYSREYITQLEGNRRKPNPSAVAALFIPALDLSRAPDEARPLLELAAASRDQSLRDHGITIRYEPRENHPSANGSADASDRLNQALSWYIEMNPEAALRLANAMEPMWMAQDNYREARTWFSRILVHSTSETVTHAEALLHASKFAQRQGDAAEALDMAEEALSMYRVKDDARGVCFALAAMGWASLDLGDDIPRARVLFRDSLALARQLNEPQHILVALYALIHETAPISADEQRWAEIEADLDEYERLARALDDVRGIAFTWAERGFLQIARGNLQEALRCQRESLRLFRSMRSRPDIGWGELSVGEALWFINDLAQAREHFERGLRIFRQTSQSSGAAIALHHLAQVDRHEKKLDAAKRRYTESLTLNRAAKNANMVARCVAGLGGVALAQGDAERATTLLAWAQAQFDALAPFLSRFDMADYGRLRDEASARLGEAGFTRAWAAGSAVTFDAAMG
jgi:tetratricopeptide (TPR) repeat protein